MPGKGSRKTGLAARIPTRARVRAQEDRMQPVRRFTQMSQSLLTVAEKGKPGGVRWGFLGAAVPFTVADRE